ncbi:hypothetical protein B9G98_01300 [Wickerhamiella sorbophila]|uniref:Uncharacterized protein n=1 Tax=Wickerhamiella sorbophila TaxID=45607 RepID=A0A2T0FFC6_9ASCO|nr:hypothetical protein B9G98_01300 [Wickerhamiella sorbophila]PRT53680.1 hypothetical protein B9G98_01300 [Wickerhamiella sorbophila]
MIPSSTADRLLRNPHVLPHMPSDLAGMVAYNRHQALLGTMAEAAYQQRRERRESIQMDVRRRISQSNRDAAVASDSDSDTDIIADLPTETTPNRRKPRRRSMFEAAQQFKSPEKHSMNDSFSSRPTRSHSFSSSAQTSPSVMFWSCEGIVSGIDRVRARCNLLKRPHPGLWTRRASTGSPTHPFWHTRLRQTYITADNDAAWRQERTELMRAHRRDRQFETLMARRRSQ